MPLHPNIVLICVDQWRGDCLSIAGHPVVHTPYLDELALDGCRFDRAYAAVPSCIAARASLYTGLHQRTHGRVGYQDAVPWDYDAYLATHFARAGYHTQAVGKLHASPPRSLLGFHHVVLHDGYIHHNRREHRHHDAIDDFLPWLRAQLGRDADEIEHGLDCNSIVARPWDKPEHTHPSSFVAGESIRFLHRRDPGRPFFLFMSFHRPHPPYDPPAWAFERYLGREMPDPPLGDWAALFERWHEPFRHNGAAGRIAREWLHRARAGYYGHMTHIDGQINRFLMVLEELGLLATTFVAFVSDHGEMLGDHHLFRKTLPYEGSARVPLILKGPRDAGLKAGHASAAPIELRDVLPTLLDCAGLPPPEGVEGRSFLPLARGQAPEALNWRGHVQGEHTGFGGSTMFVVDSRWKYVWFSASGHEQLFDLQADPQELRDLAPRPEHGQGLARLRAALVEELRGREEDLTDGQSLRPGCTIHSTMPHLRRRVGLNY